VRLAVTRKSGQEAFQPCLPAKRRYHVDLSLLLPTGSQDLFRHGQQARFLPGSDLPEVLVEQLFAGGGLDYLGGGLIGQDTLPGQPVVGQHPHHRGFDDLAIQFIRFPELPFGLSALGDLQLELDVLLFQSRLQTPQGEMRCHPCQDLGCFKGLGEVVNASGLEPLDLVPDLVKGTDEDDRDIAALLLRLQGPAHLVAVHVGHFHIQQDQVGPSESNRPQGQLAAGGRTHPISLPGQDLSQQLQICRDIVDDQNLGWVHLLRFLIHHVSSSPLSSPSRRTSKGCTPRFWYFFAKPGQSLQVKAISKIAGELFAGVVVVCVWGGAGEAGGKGSGRSKKCRWEIPDYR